MTTFISTLLAFTLSAAPPDLAARLTRLAAPAHGTVGVAAQILESGVSVGIHAGDPFPMQSVYKLPIAMAILDQIDHGTLTLDRSIAIRKEDLVPRLVSPMRDRHPDGGFNMTIQELLQAAIVDSDGSASDILFGIAGGVQPLMDYLRRIGVSGIEIAATERAMSLDEQVQYRNSATPQGAVALLAALQRGQGITAPHRDLLLGWLRQTQTGARRIRAGVPAGTDVADKTGTDGTRHGLTRATNDIALVTMPDGTHLAVAVFIKDSTASQAVREGTIARIAGAVFSAWTTPAAR